MCYGVAMSTNKKPKVTFTPLEWELIKDRPEDCIIECHLDTPDDCPPCQWTKEELDHGITKLYGLKAGDEIDLSDPLTFSILEDCIDGGTIMMRCSPEDLGYSEFITKGKWCAMVRAAKSVQKKTGVPFYW
tara:strand:- start:2107 stop:2499 length:393 start_codon:yes stop_codon:yes gene_type:complete